MAAEPFFLDVNDVLLIHADSIAHEGGAQALRDGGLLEAAVAMPRQRYAGAYLHDGLAAMAAAYLYHLAMNHPFVDGNKRVAAMSALVFLRANGVERLPDATALTDVTMAVAASKMSKAELTAWFATQLA